MEQRRVDLFTVEMLAKKAVVFLEARWRTAPFVPLFFHHQAYTRLAIPLLALVKIQVVGLGKLEERDAAEFVNSIGPSILSTRRSSDQDRSLASPHPIEISYEFTIFQLLRYSMR